MSNATIIRLQDEKQDREKFVAGLLDAAESEERALTDSEIANVQAAKERIGQIVSQLEPLISWEEQRSSAAELDSRIKVADRRAVQVREPEPLLGGKTLGQAFFESPEFRSSNGSPMRDRFVAPTTLGEVRAPALLTTSTDPGKAFMPTPQKIMTPNGLSAFRLWDAVRHVQVRSAAVDYVTYGSLAGAKTPAKVPEGTAKPEVELTATTTNVSLETWAGWVQITRQLLQDGIGIRSFIDGELTRGLLTQLEADIVAKLKASSVAAVTGGAGQPLQEVIRVAVATVEANGFTPTAVALNPADAAAIDIATAKLGGANAFLPNAMPWGLQVIPVPGLTAGEAWVGDFETGVALLERTGVEIFTTDSHVDNFVKNIFVILAEIRAAAVVAQPNALVKTKLTP